MGGRLQLSRKANLRPKSGDELSLVYLGAPRTRFLKSSQQTIALGETRTFGKRQIYCFKRGDAAFVNYYESRRQCGATLRTTLTPEVLDRDGRVFEWAFDLEYEFSSRLMDDLREHYEARLYSIRYYQERGTFGALKYAIGFMHGTAVYDRRPVVSFCDVDDMLIPGFATANARRDELLRNR